MPPTAIPNQATANSLLDVMVDGREFESVLSYSFPAMDIRAELRRSISEIENCRGRPLICVVANVVNPNVKAPISINQEDDLPFCELISSIEAANDAIDILLVTPGGSAQQVDKFVNALRARFADVSFILPNVAMSAGTIFIMSGDELLMHGRACFGPIDPQVPNKDGVFVPAQTLRTLIDDIQKRGDDLVSKGQNPPWTDIQMLRFLDYKEVGNELTASQYSVDLVRRYLKDYKFKSWLVHQSTGAPVTDDEKDAAALSIAQQLCNHKLWKAHGHGISRETARNVLGLKITDTEAIDGLDRAVRRFWALLYWVFESTQIYKVFISEKYCIFKNDLSLGPFPGGRQ